MKTGLVLEGGALRTIFSSGVCDAFLNEKLPMPDYTIGVSAGIAYGVSYLSRQKRRNLQLLMHYANDRRYMGWGNFFDPRNRCYFGLKFAYDTIPNELVPLTSARRSGSSSMIRKVSALNFFTILLAKAAPMPLIAPEPRYRSIASVSSGAFIS